MSNKKVKGAEKITINNLNFKSKLEFNCYKKLEESGLTFSYESEKITLWEGVKLKKVVFYAPKRIGIGKYNKDMELQTRVLLPISYTPDFIVVKGNNKIYFDAKGKENETYPIKKKMFLKYLENKDDGIKYFFFEPHNIRQLMEAIAFIKKL